MSGPAPLYQPVFPPEFLAKCQQIAKRRATSFGEVLRARLVLLLHDRPSVSNVEAGLEFGLHPNAIRLWRRRWAEGEFSLDDQTGRGRKPTFSPS